MVLQFNYGTKIESRYRYECPNMWSGILLLLKKTERGRDKLGQITNGYCKPIILKRGNINNILSSAKAYPIRLDSIGLLA